MSLLANYTRNVGLMPRPDFLFRRPETRSVFFPLIDQLQGATVMDRSGNANNGNIIGAGLYWRKLPSGFVVHEWMGSGDRIDVPDSATYYRTFDGGGTIGAWIYPDDDGENDMGRIMNKTTGNYGWSFWVSNEAAGFVKLNFMHYFSTQHGYWETTPTPVPIGRWSFVAVMYNNGDVANDPVFYMNGVAQGTTETQAPVGARRTDQGGLMAIGYAAPGGVSATFDGKITLVRVWKSIVKTPDQLVNIHSRERMLFTS